MGNVISMKQLVNSGFGKYGAINPFNTSLDTSNPSLDTSNPSSDMSNPSLHPFLERSSYQSRTISKDFDAAGYRSSLEGSKYLS